MSPLWLLLAFHLISKGKTLPAAVCFLAYTNAAQHEMSALRASFRVRRFALRRARVLLQSSDSDSDRVGYARFGATPKRLGTVLGNNCPLPSPGEVEAAALDAID